MLVAMATCSATEPTLDRAFGIERSDVELDGDALAALDRRGEVIGNGYRLEHVVGIGGMGVIYRAVQQSLGRTVAIKVPRPELESDVSSCARLRAEAHVASRINHRNVVRMIDYGEHAGVPFLVMDLITGPRLGSLCRARGPLALEDAAMFVLQILAGLDATHAAGIVHADVKADNVLVTRPPDGTQVLHLIDFGLAQVLGEDSCAQTEPAAWISGTPEYLAPELVRGASPSVASDLYAVGIIFYELVTGVTPFVAETNALILSRQVAADPVPMASHRADLAIPVGYEKLVRRALAKDPGERFDSATAFRTALAQLVEASPLAEPPAFSEEPTPLLDACPVPVDDPPTAPRPAKQRVAEARLELQRHAVRTAIAEGDPDRIVLAYLELARIYVDLHQIIHAIAELEAGTQLLLRRRGRPCRSLWRLQLTLAALYAGNGDRAMAHRVSYEARLEAARAGSEVGTRRVDELARRLARPSRRAR